MLRLWAFLTRQKYIALLDADGEITFTVAKKTPFGYIAKRYWPFSTRNVLLNENGTIENGVYVTHWKDA